VEFRGGVWKFVRPQDLLWVALFGAVAVFGPEREPTTIVLLSALGVLQLLEPKLLPSSTRATVAFVGLKFAVCYLLIGWTNATTLSLWGTVATSVLASGGYLSFLYFLRPNQYVPPSEYPQLVMRALIFPAIGYLTQQLAESHRVAARRAEAAAEQAAEANRQLQEAEAAMRRSERLAALGQMSAGLAHELRNPLGTMKTSAEMLAKQVDPGNVVAREMADFISSEVDRTNSLVTRFLDFARPLAVRLERTDLTQVIDRAIADVERHSPPFDVAIYKNYSPDIPPFLLDGQLIERVVYNLLVNAAQASRPGASVTVKTRQVGETVEIAVIDRGAGIDAKHLESIFNPFFTTKSSGVGLGLAIVSKIIDEHGGKLAVESESGVGSVFHVYLPFRRSTEKDGK
jgi:signal transduction histidine kinase